MVDLNRQIRATQARQGGFSAHVLPGPVGRGLPQNLLLWLRNQIQDISAYAGTVTELGVTLSDDEFKFLPPAFQFYADPQEEERVGIEAVLGDQINSQYPLPIGTQDFTLEFWLRHEDTQNEWGRVGPDQILTFRQYESLITFNFLNNLSPLIEILEGHVCLNILSGIQEMAGFIPGGGGEDDRFLVHQTSILPYSWAHVALTREDGVVLLFVNGQPSNVSINYDEAIGNSFVIGNWWRQVSGTLPDQTIAFNIFAYTGRMQHIKVWHGAIYQASGFTPPNAP